MSNRPKVEVLRRLRNGGSQFLRVEHVHVSDGGQAIVGNVGRQIDRHRSDAGFLAVRTG
jgi:hypothetical protein